MRNIGDYFGLSQSRISKIIRPAPQLGSLTKASVKTQDPRQAGRRSTRNPEAVRCQDARALGAGHRVEAERLVARAGEVVALDHQLAPGIAEVGPGEAAPPWTLDRLESRLGHGAVVGPCGGQADGAWLQARCCGSSSTISMR
jgi:hypothetical protein